MAQLDKILRLYSKAKIAYHLNAVVFNWSNEENTLGNQFQFLKRSKESVRPQLKEQSHLGLAIKDIPDATGKGGTSTTGNVIHALFS